MSDLKSLQQRLTPFLGTAEAQTFTAELAKLGDSTHAPWKAAVISLASDAIDKHGQAGLGIALAALSDIKQNKVPKIDWAELATASDVLAALQNAEAGRKSEAYDFLVKLSAIITPLLKIVLSSLL